MLINLSKIENYTLAVNAEDALPIMDYIFDTKYWFVQYIVAETDREGALKKVLISTSKTKRIDFEQGKIIADLDRKALEKSAAADIRIPVSWEKEIELAQLFKWPLRHMNITELNLNEAHKLAKRMALEANVDFTEANPFLRSYKEIRDYALYAEGEDVGRIEELIIDEKDFKVRFLQVEIGGLLGEGKRTLISPVWIEKINWEKNAIHLDLTKNILQNSPEFLPGKGISKDFELKLFKYFGNRN